MNSDWELPEDFLDEVSNLAQQAKEFRQDALMFAKAEERATKAGRPYEERKALSISKWHAIGAAAKIERHIKKLPPMEDT